MPQQVRGVVARATGAPVSIETVVVPDPGPGETVVLVAVPDPRLRLDLPLIDFFARGGALESSRYDDCLPSRNFPMPIDLYSQGRLPLDRLVTEEIPLDGVEEALWR